MFVPEPVPWVRVLGVTGASLAACFSLHFLADALWLMFKKDLQKYNKSDRHAFPEK
jgi:hypothetical protein